MDLTKLPLFETMRQRMTYLTARQGTLAENVANANTPGYKAQDVESPDFAAMAAGETTGMAPLNVTNAMHFATGIGDVNGGFRIAKMPDSESTPNGNSVVLEDQMIKVADVQMDFSTVSQLYKKALGMIRLAAGGQR